MPIRKGENGERSIEASIQVPGSPEEVWRAIATGAGISSWFVPTTSDERVGGSTVASFGPGMDAASAITKWNPPHSYVAEAEEGPLKVATEWTLETRDGGTCTVRVVHRWFADTDDWDAQFEGHAYGWATSFFRMLRLYLEHFAGQPCAAFQLTAISQSPGPETWRTIRSALRIDGNRRVTSAPGAPELVGAAEDMEVTDPELLRARSTPQIAAALAGMDGEDPELLVRLQRPGPGLAHIFLVPLGGPTMVSARFHFYGDQREALAAEAERQWGAWLAREFPEESATN